jgi:hypothetical protein
MDLLRTKIENIRTVFKYSKKLKERISPMYQHTQNSTIYQLIDKSRDIEQSYNFLKEGKDIGPMLIAHHIGVCDGLFSDIVSIISQLDMMSSTKASPTYILETVLEFNEFENIVSDHLNNPLNNDLMEFLMNKIKDIDPKEVETMYKNNKHATALFAKYLQYHIDSPSTNDASIYYEILERAKTDVLAEGRGPPIPPSKRTMPLQRFGLMPVLQGLSITTLIEAFMGTGACSGDTLDSFIKCAFNMNINVLVIKNITSYPIEFNLWKLINKPDAQGYIFDWTTGINQKIIERYNTISEMEIVENQSLGYEARPYIKTEGGSWFVVRTLNGKNWDIMSNVSGFIGGSVYSFPPKSLSISNELVQKILRGPSPRVDVYNENKNNSFAALIGPVKDATAEIKLENVGLINTLIHRITNKIIEYVDKVLVPLPITPKEIELAIMDPVFIEIANVEMLKSYSECGINNRLPIDELVGSFISDVDSTIVVQLGRNLKYNIIEFGPSSKIFKEYSGPILKTKIYNIFVDIIKKSVSATIRSKENIYEKILVKNNLLGLIL